MLLAMFGLSSTVVQQKVDTEQRKTVQEARMDWALALADITGMMDKGIAPSLESATANLDKVKGDIDTLKSMDLPSETINGDEGKTYVETDLLKQLDASYTAFRPKFDAFVAEVEAAPADQQTAIALPFIDYAVVESGEGEDKFLGQTRLMLEGYTAMAATDITDLDSQANKALIIGIIFTALSSIILIIVPGPVAKPIARGLKSMQADVGDYQSLNFLKRIKRQSNDEIGDMAEDLEIAFANVSKSLHDIKYNLKNGADAITEVLATAQAGEAMVGKGLDFINNGAAAAEQVSSNISTVAAGAEEMGASIREISSNANEAAKIAAEATEVAARTNETVAKLGESSQEIGAVIETITAVAEQTNLLALNATIEAARAGEAGRGFAVVASEVKDLAAETSTATQDVAARIEQIQKDTEEAVAAIEEISGIIASINDYQTTIAAAVEEQTATTAEMARSVQEASDGSTTIAENVNDIARKTRDLSEIYEQGGQVVRGMGASINELLGDFDSMKLRESRGKQEVAQ
ncbi:methyl-accepting chemotaxis protein [Mobiluncus sp.]|uniref:methyl-accepting chemotaxis protein n=1 Tax=Mobiluncus sp. TaxID=47293 RepID=UPI002A909FB5|nr:methyl-accepting chemotaxis protein [Mobiluncus sp.]MDY6076216.1 methyl-accepting chemotaxis protein [Mobiluncus sp.]